MWRSAIPVFVLLAAVVGLAGPAAAESSTGTVAGTVQPKPPLKLTDAQRHQVTEAINREDTLEKPPADFQPAIGAKVPVQAKLPGHPLPRPLVYKIPALKQYYYARLPDKVLIIDPMTKTVVDIIAQ